jgi:hypothetical protein
MAEGALPYAAMPAGKLSTPAPTMLFTRLNISLGMDAVPADGDDGDDEDDELSSTALHSEVLLLLLLSWRRTEDLVPLLLLPRNTVDGQDLNDSNDDDVEGCTIESTECRVVDG